MVQNISVIKMQIIIQHIWRWKQFYEERHSTT